MGGVVALKLAENYIFLENLPTKGVAITATTLNSPIKLTLILKRIWGAVLLFIANYMILHRN